MKKDIEVNSTLIFLMFLIGMQSIFAQISNYDEIRYDSIKCIDIKFTIIDYKLSLYNVAYTFDTKNNEIIVINKKCNYQTTGIYFTNRRTEKLFGFQIDSIYSIVLSKEKIDFKEQVNPLSYYSYVKFDKNRHLYNSKSFNSNKKIEKKIDVIFSFNCIVDINDAIYVIDGVYPFHPPPNFLLPSKIYPFYKCNKRGKYIVNKKFQEQNKYYRITINDDGETILSPLHKTRCTAQNAVKSKKRD